jgi:hypothetical protein
MKLKGETMEEMFNVWRCNMFDDNILTDFVADFVAFDDAKDFVDYKASLGESFAVLHLGEKIY